MDEWIEFRFKSGATMCMFNKKTQQYMWPAGAQTIQPVSKKQYCSVETQTDHISCINGCTSKYIKDPSKIPVEEEPPRRKERFILPKVSETQLNEQADSFLGSVGRMVSMETNCHGNTGSGRSILTNGRTENSIHNPQQVNSDVPIQGHIFDHGSYCKKPLKILNPSLTIKSSKKIEKNKSENPKPAKKNKEERPFACVYCMKKFKAKKTLEIHLRTHTGERPFECSFCLKAFGRKEVLKEHVRIHTGEKPWKCPYCDKRFAFKKSWKNHKLIHTGVKAFDCSYCQKKFKLRTELRKHIRIHTGEKPHECAYCLQKFNSKYGLKNHLVKHTGVMPYECSYCKKKFIRRSNMRKHVEKEHKNTTTISTNTIAELFQCSDCDMKFVLKSNLDSHLTTHDSDKTIHDVEQEHLDSGFQLFQCPKCDKTFSLKENLDAHLSTHAMEMTNDTQTPHDSSSLILKLFECPECDEKYSLQEPYNAHLKTHQLEKLEESLNIGAMNVGVMQIKEALKEQLEEPCIFTPQEELEDFVL